MSVRARRWLLTCSPSSPALEHTSSREASGYAIDPAACCAVPEGTDYEVEATACEARGCQWQAALLCMGVPFPDDEAEAEHRTSAERCERRCACVCAEDVEACANTP
ncbi:MAG: hypothetical protein R3B99_00120 [Polyangiales bacterium]